MAKKEDHNAGICSTKKLLSGSLKVQCRVTLRFKLFYS